MPKTAPVYIGTSGCVYSDWQGEFYPADLPNKKLLSNYSRNFGTTEINYSFYHIPRPATYRNWAAQVPEDFLFAVKAHRTITHIRRLKNAVEIWQEFLENALELGAKRRPWRSPLKITLR